MSRAERTPVLALNSGSSSLKFGLYEVGAQATRALLTGAAEGIGEERGRFWARDRDGHECVSEDAPIADQQHAVRRIGKILGDNDLPAPAAVGHRIVHGGPRCRRHCLIDESVLKQLEAAIRFAPLHVPPALAVIRFARQHFAHVPQAACLDTEFHAGLPDRARVLPIPKELRDDGVERYGFHGLSCESILRQLGADRPERLVIAHLGSGASVTAVEAGRSIDTSMGLTPSGGVIMGTRSGDLDPGVLVYLMREKKLDAAGLEDLIDHRSGLRGISGLAGDMRRLHEAAPHDPDAALAIDMFCYSVRKAVAAMAASLGGLDLLVFTGGIGEHDAAVRERICGGLGWLGIGLGDPAARSRVRVLPALEDEQIARHTAALIAVERARGDG